MYHRFLPATAALLVLALSGGASAKKSALDAGLYTDYSLFNGTGVEFDVCGTAGQSSGCFGGGLLSPLERPCAVLEGAPKTKQNVMTRDIYVLDGRTSGDDMATLYVYKRTDTFPEQGGVDIKSALKKKVTLHFTRGSRTVCLLGGSDVFVYAGMAGGNYDRIDKKALTAQGRGTGGLISFTVDDRGYVTINDAAGHTVERPDGTSAEGGGGHEYMTGTRNGLTFN